MTWKDELGKFIEWKDGVPVEMLFQHEEPRKTAREWKGVQRDAYEWDVEVKGHLKILQASAYGLLKQLKAIPELTAQPVRITRTGARTETRYKVEVQKKLK